MCESRWGQIGFVTHRIELRVGLEVLGELDCVIVSRLMLAVHCVLRCIPVSPASPEYAIRVCLLSCLVLSSAALRMVAPRMAALEAAIKVKSLPVMPSRTSLRKISKQNRWLERSYASHISIVFRSVVLCCEDSRVSVAVLKKSAFVRLPSSELLWRNAHCSFSLPATLQNMWV